jgi:hypothetical protein
MTSKIRLGDRKAQRDATEVKIWRRQERARLIALRMGNTVRDQARMGRAYHRQVKEVPKRAVGHIGGILTFCTEF